MSVVRITRTKDKDNPDDPKGIITIEINRKQISLPELGQTKAISLEVKAANTRLEFVRDD